MKKLGKLGNLVRPDLIIFDLDNTLYSYDEPHKIALQETLEKYSYKFNTKLKDALELYITARKIVKTRLINHTSSHSRLLYFKQMIERAGLSSSATIALELDKIYWRSFISNAKLFPDVFNFLDDLRLLKIRLAIITNLTTEVQFRKLIAFEIESFFDYIISSEESGIEKPNSKIFLLLIEKLKANNIKKPENIWMIGDDFDADMKGAKDSLSATTFLKKTKNVKIKDKNSVVDYSFTNFKELRDFIKKT